MKRLFVFSIFLLLTIFFLTGCSTFVQDIKTISKPLTYTITFDSNFTDEFSDESTIHGTMESQLFTKNKPHPLSKNKYIRDDIAFLGWADEAFATEAVYKDEALFTAVKDTTLYAVWGEPNYKIICKLQNQDGSSYGEKTVFCYGEPGTKINITAPALEGFTPKDFAPIEIEIDQNPITLEEIPITYTRNKYTISFAADAHCEGSMSSIEAWYQDEITLPDCGFTNPDVSKVFAGWAIDADETQVYYTDDDKIEVTDNLSLYAMWMDKGKSRYKVIHSFQNIGGEGYTENEELAQELWGYDGALTEAKPLVIDGFTAKTFSQVIIERNAESVQVINIDYERNKYKISFKHNGECTGEMDDEEAWYQEEIPLSDCSFTNPDTSKKFAGWSYICPHTDQINYLNDEKIEVTHNMTLYAQWEDATTSDYMVKHFFQNIKDDEYTEDPHNYPHQIFEGRDDDYTTAEAYNVPGFKALDFAQEKIKDDKDGLQTTIEIYYDRIPVTLTFDLDGGSMSSPALSEDNKLVLRYGAEVTAPVVEKEAHRFTAWTPALPSVAIADGTYTAGWEEFYTYNPKTEKGGLKGTTTKKQGSTAKRSINGLANTEDIYIVPNGTVAIINTDGSSIWGSASNLGEEEKHVHGAFYSKEKIELSPYIISKYPVTLELYESVMGKHTFETKYSPMKPYASDPVNNVSWYDAVMFCNKLSEKEHLEPVYYYIDINGTKITDPADWPIGDYPSILCDHEKNGYRLPTNAEWEFAARGGNPSAEDWDYAFSGAPLANGATLSKSYEKDANLSTVAYYKKNINNQQGPCTVGQWASNSLGLFDMSGGICEWTYDYIDSNCTTIDTHTGKLHSLRGGSYFSSAFYCTVTYILSSDAKTKRFSYGFRLCRNAE